MFSKKSGLNKKGEEYYTDGLKLNDQGNFGLAYEKFLQALLAFQNTQNWERVARCHQCIGNVAFNLQRYSESKESWDNALKIFEQQLQNKIAAAEISVEIGNVYIDMEYDGASLYYKRAISLYEESPIGNELGFAMATYKLGLARCIQQRTDEAEKLLVSALPAFQKFGQQNDIANIHKRLGDIYMHHKKDINTAKQLYRKAFEIYSVTALPREQNDVAAILEGIEREEANRELIKKNKQLAKQVRQLSRDSPALMTEEDQSEGQGEQNWEVSSTDSNNSDTDNIPISFKQNINHFSSNPKPSAPPLQKMRNTQTRMKQTKLHQIFDKVTQKQKLQKKVTERRESPNPALRALPTVLSTPPTPRRL